MKLEKGMWIRTVKEGILKLANKRTVVNDIFWSCERKNGELYTMYMDESSTIKASHNIIDLIENKDIVNGRLVTDVYDGAIKTIGKIIFDREQEQIETVLTKEQYEKYAYKVVN